MENFLKVLTAGLAIFAVLTFAGWNGPGDGGSGEPINSTIYSIDKIGTIGFAEATPREIPIGDISVGTLIADETAFEEESETIKNGLFSKSGKSIVFGGENARKATLSFGIKDTNNYGNLTVTLDGAKIFNNNAVPGQYRFELYDLNQTNTIEIFAQSSGAKFWAPTTYILSDVSVAVERYAERDRAISFQLYPYESAGWSFGRVSLVPDNVTGTGNLTINVNGKYIYIGVPARGVPNQIDFSKHETQVSTGENILSFSTSKDTVYGIKSAKLIIFYYGTGDAIYKIQQFDVNEYWKAVMRKENATGVLEFYIKAANVDSGIDVELNNKTYVFDTLKPNTWYNLTFGEKELSGDIKNSAKFSTHGSYEIGAMNVYVATGIGAENTTTSSLSKRLFG